MGEKAIGGMIRTLYWPIDAAAIGQLAPDCSWFVSFLESASKHNCKAYMMEGSVVKAVAAGGRSGEIVRRGGRGRLWEVIFAHNDQALESKFIDGSQCASDSVLSWLRGEAIDSILERNRIAIIDRPADFLRIVEKLDRADPTVDAAGAQRPS